MWTPKQAGCRYHLAGCLLGILLPLAGCGPHVNVTLQQPFAPPSQRNLELVARHAFRLTDGGRQRCLLTFPLPSADNGPQAFLLYFCGPDETGDLRIDPADPAATQGFLIQGVGALAGRTDFNAGQIRCRKPWYAPKRRQLEFDVRCTDGSRIIGQATVEDGPRTVRAFERDYAADIAQIHPVKGDSPSEPPTPTRAAPGS